MFTLIDASADDTWKVSFPFSSSVGPGEVLGDWRIAKRVLILVAILSKGSTIGSD